MHITVFGATGAIGSLTVDELLARGHELTAHARNTAKVPARWASRVRVVIGEMADAEQIDAAIVGADAVVSALGPSMDRNATGLPLVEGTGYIADGMRRHGVDRYVGQGTPSVRDPQERVTVQARLIGFVARTFLPRAYREMLGMSALVMVPDLRWTIVRFAAPNDGLQAGAVRAGFFGTDRIGFAVSRADIAAFTAAQVEDDTFVRRVPAISA